MIWDVNTCGGGGRVRSPGKIPGRNVGYDTLGGEGREIFKCFVGWVWGCGVLRFLSSGSEDYG